MKNDGGVYIFDVNSNFNRKKYLRLYPWGTHVDTIVP